MPLMASTSSARSFLRTATRGLKVSSSFRRSLESNSRSLRRFDFNCWAMSSARTSRSASTSSGSCSGHLSFHSSKFLTTAFLRANSLRMIFSTSTATLSLTSFCSWSLTLRPAGSGRSTSSTTMRDPALFSFSIALRRGTVHRAICTSSSFTSSLVGAAFSTLPWLLPKPAIGVGARAEDTFPTVLAPKPNFAGWAEAADGTAAGAGAGTTGAGTRAGTGARASAGAGAGAEDTLPTVLAAKTNFAG
mmetsp:Transcript_47782/g.147394  ORF Transcript_47782/g.147394 Transcript_47782/m.147394 type:complete len:247 (-) Transcript_47782:682-1422(-)